MVYRFDHFELDEEERELRQNGEQIPLQPLVFDLLALLVHNHRRVVSKNELMETLWPDVIVSEASLQRVISLARSALSDVSHDRIRTFTGHGYRFSGDVQTEGAALRKPSPTPRVDTKHSEPRIQYAGTADGVNIAFWTTGEGMPLVCLTNLIWSHAQLEWRFPEIRQWYERLATGRQLVRLDPRGTGLSQRAFDVYSLESLERDLTAVVDRLRLDRFALVGCINAGPVAISYAARHPERVARLILWCSMAGPSYHRESRGWQALAALHPLMERDWETYTQTRAHIELGWSQPELAHRYAALLRQCTNPQMALRAYNVINEFDVEPLLPRVSCPSLIVHRRQFPLYDEEASKHLAVRIPDARLSVFEGFAGTPYLGDVEAEVSVVEDFLGDGTSQTSAAVASVPFGTAIIVYADIADSTALTERLGDAAFRMRARELDRSLRSIISANGGIPVEGRTLGDGVLATFISAAQAIEAALVCASEGNDAGLPLHVGLHAGDIAREGKDVYGGAVNIASRVSGLAAPGEVLVSDTVRGLARTSTSFAFEDRGERAMKGVGERLRVWAVPRSEAKGTGPPSRP